MSNDRASRGLRRGLTHYGDSGFAWFLRRSFAASTGLSDIVRREHFKLVYRIKPEDMKINLQSGKQVFESLASEFGKALFRYDHYRQKNNAVDFPLRMSDGDVVSSLSLSTTLKNIPTVVVDHVYADRSCVDEARNWVEQNRADIIKPDEEEDHE